MAPEPTGTGPADPRQRLAAAGVPDPARDLRRLFDAAYAVGAATSDPQTRERPNAATRAAFETFLEQRERRIPVSQILGRRAFWRHDFLVTGDVLDPRPETETLVASALDLPFARLLDLGTGSGCILLSLLAERPEATGLGVDVSGAALAVAQRNARHLGLETQARWQQGDWCAGIDGPFDLIVSNPPYIRADEMDGLAPEVRMHEPRVALTDEGDGLGAYRRIIADAPPLLRPGGWLLVEVGAGQNTAVADLFAAAGLAKVTQHHDMDERARVIAGQRPGS